MAVAVTEAEEIQAQMRQVRSELHEDVQEIVAGARTLADWRHYVRSSPWLCIGAAAALGHLVVPSRTVVVRPTAADLLELAKDQKIGINVNPPRPTLLGTLTGMLASMVVQGGLA